MIWCAEIGSMHRGNKSLAYELIRQARWAGATIAKFQLGWTKEAQWKYAGGFDERRYVDDWAVDLARWCRELDIEFMASVWSMRGLDVARSVGMRRYKIAHQMNDAELIKSVYSDGKPVFHSGKDVLVVGQYPAYPPIEFPAQMHGYSSHMHGIADALIAVSRGAQFIEKHLTMDKTLDWPRDASFALLPSEFKQMVDIGNEMERIR